MAKMRVIRPGFWDDSAVCGVSRDARLLLIATWTLADDEGRLRWSAELLKENVFGGDEDLHITHVQVLMNSLTASNLITPYMGSHGVMYAVVVGFMKYQKTARPKPSTLPAPDSYRTIRGTVAANFGTDSIINDAPPRLSDGKHCWTHGMCSEDAVSFHGICTDTALAQFSKGKTTPHCMCSEDAVSPHCSCQIVNTVRLTADSLSLHDGKHCWTHCTCSEDAVSPHGICTDTALAQVGMGETTPHCRLSEDAVSPHGLCQMVNTVGLTASSLSLHGAQHCSTHCMCHEDAVSLHECAQISPYPQFRAPSLHPHGACHEDAVSPHGTLSEGAPLERKGKEGKGEEINPSHVKLEDENLAGYPNAKSTTAAQQLTGFNSFSSASLSSREDLSQQVPLTTPDADEDTSSNRTEGGLWMFEGDTMGIEGRVADPYGPRPSFDEMREQYRHEVEAAAAKNAAKAAAKAARENAGPSPLPPKSPQNENSIKVEQTLTKMGSGPSAQPQGSLMATPVDVADAAPSSKRAKRAPHIVRGAVNDDGTPVFADWVYQICDHLAARVEKNLVDFVGKGYTGTVQVNDVWWKAAEQMVRLDGIPVEKIRLLIDWSTQDVFWRTNIRSMLKLRKQAMGFVMDERFLNWSIANNHPVADGTTYVDRPGIRSVDRIRGDHEYTQEL